MIRIFVGCSSFEHLARNQEKTLRIRSTHGDPSFYCSFEGFLGFLLVCNVDQYFFTDQYFFIELLWDGFSHIFSFNFCICGWNRMVLPFNWNLFSRHFASVVIFIFQDEESRIYYSKVDCGQRVAVCQKRFLMLSMHVYRSTYILRFWLHSFRIWHDRDCRRVSCHAFPQ